MLPIKYLTIHCAATPEGRNSTAEEVKAWDVARFGQPAYHVVIELDGSPHRHLLDTERGAHVGNHNTGNIGVCYVGGCDIKMQPKDTRTQAQKVTLKRLIENYAEKYPGIIVRGHRDWPGVTKACPSFDVHAWIKAGMPTT